MPNKKFPVKEAEIMLLAKKVLAGMKKNELDFGSSPYPMKDLQRAIEDYDVCLNRLVETSAAQKEAVRQKDLVVTSTTDGVKRIIKFAENQQDAEKYLREIGWTGRRAKGTGESPGKTGSLQATAWGVGWLSLIWFKPEKGGGVTMYIVQWREYPLGEWKTIYETTSTYVNLVNIPVDIPYEYRVYGKNAAGSGEASNSVLVTLRP